MSIVTSCGLRVSVGFGDTRIGWLTKTYRHAIGVTLVLVHYGVRLMFAGVSGSVANATEGRTSHHNRYGAVWLTLAHEMLNSSQSIIAKRIRATHKPRSSLPLRVISLLAQSSYDS